MAEQYQSGDDTNRGHQPEGPIHNQVYSASQSTWDQFVNGRVDGRVLAADTDAREEAED